jgi:hypothetical protein
MPKLVGDRVGRLQVDVLTGFGNAVRLGPFYAAFVLAPLASNAAEFIGSMKYLASPHPYPTHPECAHYAPPVAPDTRHCALLDCGGVATQLRCEEDQEDNVGLARTATGRSMHQ